MSEPTYDQPTIPTEAAPAGPTPLTVHESFIMPGLRGRLDEAKKKIDSLEEDLMMARAALSQMLTEKASAQSGEVHDITSLPPTS